MDQFLTGQARHHGDQIGVAAVLGDQAQRRAGRLEFAVLVVDQHDVLIGQRRLDPGLGRAATKKLVDFRQAGGGAAAVGQWLIGSGGWKRHGYGLWRLAI